MRWRSSVPARVKLSAGTCKKPCFTSDSHLLFPREPPILPLSPISIKPHAQYDHTSFTLPSPYFPSLFSFFRFLSPLLKTRCIEVHACVCVWFLSDKNTQFHSLYITKHSLNNGWALMEGICQSQT